MSVTELDAIRTWAGVPAPAPLWTSARWAPPGPGFVNRAFAIGDLISGLVALCGALLLLNLDHLPRGVAAFLELRITIEKLLLLTLFAVCWHRIFAWLGLYRQSRIEAYRVELARIVVACSLGTIPALLFLPFSESGSFTLQTVLLFWAFSIPVVITTRETIQILGTSLAGQRQREVLIVGSGPRARALAQALDGLAGMDAERPRLVGFVDSDDSVPDAGVRGRLLGTLDDLETLLMHRVVDEVMIALPIKSRYQEIQDVIHTCERLGVQSTYLADIFQPSLGRVRYEHAHPFAIHTVKVVPEGVQLAIKRAIDIVGAGLGLMVLAPMLLLIAAAVRLSSPGPALFTQQRYGLNKRLFRMYKFRTMVPDAETLQPALEDRNEAKGPVFKIAADPRVTALGRFLRRASLDELPQLWNVLRGEMSLVGPRPLPLRDVGRFQEGWLMRRFSMRPGLTCLWQIAGRSDLGFDAWVELDLKYIDTWSLWLDGHILLKTIPVVLWGTGAQ